MRDLITVDDLCVHFGPQMRPHKRGSSSEFQINWLPDFRLATHMYGNYAHLKVIYLNSRKKWSAYTLLRQPGSNGLRQTPWKDGKDRKWSENMKNRKPSGAFRYLSSFWRQVTECTRRFPEGIQSFCYHCRSLSSYHEGWQSAYRHHKTVFGGHLNNYTLYMRMYQKRVLCHCRYGQTGNMLS